MYRYLGRYIDTSGLDNQYFPIILIIDGIDASTTAIVSMSQSHRWHYHHVMMILSTMHRWVIPSLNRDSWGPVEPSPHGNNQFFGAFCRTASFPLVALSDPQRRYFSLPNSLCRQLKLGVIQLWKFEPTTVLLFGQLPF
jgi:hypothetical protein